MILIEFALDVHVRRLWAELTYASGRDANALRWAAGEHLNALQNLAGSREDVTRLIEAARVECGAYLEALGDPMRAAPGRQAALSSIEDLEVGLA
jgi:hypothetical protein